MRKRLGQRSEGGPLGIMVVKDKGLLPGWVHQHLVGMGPLRGNCGEEARDELGFGRLESEALTKPFPEATHSS